MNFTIERSRSAQKDALSTASQIFTLCKKSDALFTDSSRERIIVFTGLEYYAPICSHLLNDEKICACLAGIGKDLLIQKEDDDFYLSTPENRQKFPEDIAEAIRTIYEQIFAAPGYINENGELVIDLKGYRIGSHYAVNLLLGERSEYADCLQATPKAVLDELGRGSFRGKQEKQVLATRYVLSPEENGEPVNRQFYLTENGRQIFYSADIETNIEKACCIHSQNRSRIIYETKCGLRITRTIFLLPQEKDQPTAIEAQRIRIENFKKEPRDLRIVATGMFGITDPGTLAGDIIFANVVVESELYYLNGRPIAMAAHHQPAECNGEKRFALLLNEGEPFEEYCSFYPDFIGKGSIEKPEMVARLNNAHSRRQASFFAMGKSFHLEKEAIIDTFVGMSDHEGDVSAVFDKELATLYEKYKDPKALGQTLDKMIADNNAYYSYLTLHDNDPLFDSYVSRNLPFQVLYQTYVSRSFAWSQKSYRETGFREIQDIFASMYYMHANRQDDLIRRLISSWIENVFEFGYAYHNFTTRGKEPGMCSDDQLWLIQAVYRYVRLSGDTSFLKQEFKVAGSDQKRTLLDTLKAIIIYSGRISIGKHQMPLLDTADWNDCLRLDKQVLSGPEKEEAYYEQLKTKKQEFGVPLENTQSESVMNACLLKIAADELCEMAKLIGDDETDALCKQISADIYTSMQESAWINGYFARCLINDGRPYSYLGSKGDRLSLDPNIDGTYYLNSYSWPLLADIASEQQISDMLEVIDSYLKTPAGLKLVSPVDYDKLGIVTGSSFYFPGDRENGGVFKHAAMMATVASLQKAKTVKDQQLAQRLKDLAFFMIDKTLPYKTLEDPYILKGNPRFCTQYNNSETGEGIGPILSGTASWLTLAIYEILGIEYKGDKISFEPIINTPKLHYTLKLKDTKLEVTIRQLNDYKVNRNSRFFLDGKECEQCITVPEDQKVHRLEIEL